MAGGRESAVRYSACGGRLALDLANILTWEGRWHGIGVDIDKPQEDVWEVDA